MLLSEFSHNAKKTLFHIVESIENQDSACLLDIDFDGDIITIECQAGVFVINKHSAAKEIWLSSPLSGPYHFSLVDNKWRSSSGDDLHYILSNELNIKFI